MKCKNTRYDHHSHPSYGDYCLHCQNAGVPEFIEERDRLNNELENLRVEMAAMRMKTEAAVKSREELKGIIDGYKAIVEDSSKERNRLNSEVVMVNAENVRLAGELEAARKKLSAILECWIDGIGAIDNSWRKRMAELVGDVDGLAEAKQDGTEDRIAALERQNAELKAACDEFRDSVLHSRHQLAETIEDSGQVNAILGLFDDTIAAALLGERKEWGRERRTR